MAAKDPVEIGQRDY
ncbi:unnamed protein product [Linum tenue]|uniref:Uncharacterized protein n=1 Tax=Linum tenue TaxID=586396 RepID=A0AAV0H4V0_9ROSI|nr:unnamed protein product [Linum tenue]